MFKVAATLGMAALAVSMTVSSAEAGVRGLMAGLFIGAVGAHIIDHGMRAERRREAYEAEQMRRMMAARRAAAIQQARAAEFQRLQAQKAKAAQIAAANAAAATTQPATTTSTSTVASTETTPAEKTTTVAKATTTETTEGTPCRKYSATTGGMIDAVCP